MLTGEEGSGPVSTVFGVAMFLGFLLLATQTLLHLYATSIVTTVAFDTAWRLAAEDGGGCPDADPRARSLLGGYGRRPDVKVACRWGADRVDVTISGPTPAQLVQGLGVTVFRDGIERTATVRVEELR